MRVRAGVPTDTRAGVVYGHVTLPRIEIDGDRVRDTLQAMHLSRL
jgi:hypothetical protein